MKEDLNLSTYSLRLATTSDGPCVLTASAGQNELNWLSTFFNIGIIIGSPFTTTALTVIQPRYWLPACTVVWSVFVLCMYKATDVKTLYILR